MNASVVAIEQREDGETLYLVESDEPLELGQVLTLKPRTAATLLGRFVCEGDLIGEDPSTALLVRSVRPIEFLRYREQITDESIEVTYVDRSKQILDPYEPVPVWSRVCEHCLEVFTTTARKWPDRPRCQRCDLPRDEPMDPNEGPF